MHLASQNPNIPPHLGLRHRAGLGYRETGKGHHCFEEREGYRLLHRVD